jgi:hypothetical protein
LTHHFALIQIKALKTMRDMVIKGDKVVLYVPNSSGKSTVIHFPPLALTEFSAGQYYNSDVMSGLALERAEAVVKFRELQVEIGGYNLSARRDDGSWWRSTVTSPDGWGQVLVVWHIDGFNSLLEMLVLDCGADFYAFKTSFNSLLEMLFKIATPFSTRNTGR